MVAGLPSSSPLLKLANVYTEGTGTDECVLAGTDNNGNVQRQKTTVGATDFNTVYVYDGLNRVTSAVETNGGQRWNQGFTSDTWGIVGRRRVWGARCGMCLGMTRRRIGSAERDGGTARRGI